ncbi:MAG: hypothetical protein ACRCUM_03205 [Mycoplasmoidaceae bacterium]
MNGLGKTTILDAIRYSIFIKMKTKLFIISHLSIESKGFEILDFIKRQYENKNMKMEYLIPKKINNYTFCV